MRQNATRLYRKTINTQYSLLNAPIGEVPCGIRLHTLARACLRLPSPIGSGTLHIRKRGNSLAKHLLLRGAVLAPKRAVKYRAFFLKTLCEQRKLRLRLIRLQNKIADNKHNHHTKHPPCPRYFFHNYRSHSRKFFGHP